MMYILAVPNAHWSTLLLKVQTPRRAEIIEAEPRVQVVDLKGNFDEFGPKETFDERVRNVEFLCNKNAKNMCCI